MKHAILGILTIVLILTTSDLAATYFRGTYYDADWAILKNDFWKGRDSFTTSPDTMKVPVQFPGPLDAWAGGDGKEIIFELADAHDIVLTLELLDSHDTAPPKLEFSVNGASLAAVQTEKGAGAPAAEWKAKGKRSIITIRTPSEKLRSGKNILSIKSVAGSWVALNGVSIQPKPYTWQIWLTAIGWPLLLLGYALYVYFTGLWRQHAALARDAIEALEHIVTNPYRASIIVIFIVFAASFIPRAALVPFNADDDRKRWLLTGDEPEYLIAAYSLAHDFDMNIRNNVENGDGKHFFRPGYPGKWHGSLGYFQQVSPAMKSADPDEWKNRQLLVHRPGTSALIAPATLSLKHARWWAYVTMSAVGAVMAATIVFLAISNGLPPLPSALFTVLFILSPPSMYYMNQIFPELAFAMFLGVAVFSLFSPKPALLYIAAVLVALCPWFSDRAIPASAVIGLGVFLSSKEWRDRAVIAGIFAVSAAFLINYYYNRFGVPYPIHHSPRHSVSLSYLPKGLARAFLDAENGLLWQVPALALLPAALYEWKKSRAWKGAWLIVTLSLFLSLMLIASFPDWTGGASPSGRYFVLLQWLALPVFLVWAKLGMSARQKWLVNILVIAGFTQSLFLMRKPLYWYAEHNPIFSYRLIQPYYSWLPNLRNFTEDSITKIAIWGTVFVMLVLFSFRKNKVRKL